MYRVFVTNEFLGQLRRLELPIRNRLEKKLKEYVYPQIKAEPHFGVNIKKLRNSTPETWRYRIGDFRLFYMIDETEETVAFISIDHRKDAY